MRIDVENPNPGQRAGQIHFQDQNNKKYMYDFKSNQFIDPLTGKVAPKWINDLLDLDKVIQSINTGKRYLGMKHNNTKRK